MLPEHHHEAIVMWGGVQSIDAYDLLFANSL
jgi:hypothetical protein